MTRKHYNEISRIIDDTTLLDNNNLINKRAFIKELCFMLTSDNERFSRTRFVEACYKTKWVNGKPITQGKE